LSSKTIVGADPGKFNLVYLTDGKKRLRYTAFQRRNESMSRRNNIIMQIKKRKRPDVVKNGLEMSKHNSKTVDYEKFKYYLKAKNKLNMQLRLYFKEKLFRTMRWRIMFIDDRVKN
jgi:hypothetical protein